MCFIRFLCSKNESVCFAVENRRFCSSKQPILKVKAMNKEKRQSILRGLPFFLG